MELITAGGFPVRSFPARSIQISKLQFIPMRILGDSIFKCISIKDLRLIGTFIRKLNLQAIFMVPLQVIQIGSIVFFQGDAADCPFFFALTLFFTFRFRLLLADSNSRRSNFRLYGGFGLLCFRYNCLRFGNFLCFDDTCLRLDRFFCSFLCGICLRLAGF